MPVRRLNGAEFQDLAGEILNAGHRVRFQASGGSMRPSIQTGDILEVAPLASKRIRWGDVLLVEASPGKLLAHRVVKIGRHEGIPAFLLKGDACASPDGWFRAENILGRVELVERGCRQIKLTLGVQPFKAWMWVVIAPWASRFSWLPQQFRRHTRRWLLGV